jgi:hypothetical protein
MPCRHWTGRVTATVESPEPDTRRDRGGIVPHARMRPIVEGAPDAHSSSRVVAPGDRQHPRIASDRMDTRTHRVLTRAIGSVVNARNEPTRGAAVPTTDAAERGALRRRLSRPAVLLLVLAVLGLAAAGPAMAAPPTASDQPTWTMPEQGDLLGAFNRNEYDEQDGAPRTETSPDDSAQQALLFSLDGGDQRSELRPRTPDVNEGDVTFYTYTARLADDFPVDVDRYQILLQWHHYGDSGSPPIALEVRGGRLVVTAEGEDLQDLGTISGGDRVDVTMRIAFSQDPERSRIDVWRDGRAALRGYQPADGTLLDAGNYLKTGLYRSSSLDDGGARLWLEDLKVGPTLASVRSQGSASEAISENDTADDPAATSSSGSSTALWVAGALLAAVVLLGVLVLRGRRRVHRW